MSTTLRTVAVAVISSLVTTLVMFQVMIPAPENAEGKPVSNPLFDADHTAQESAVVAAVDAAEEAVVSVVISKDMPIVERYFEEVPFGNGFFSPFDIQVPRYRENGTQLQEIGGGTAFFISPDGLLLTNKHVVNDSEAQYTVILNDGRRLNATVVAQHPTNDIALIQVEGEDFPYLSFDDEEPLLGQTTIAIGNALAEFRNTVSLGVISGLSRSIAAGSIQGGLVEQLDHIIQTDAAINQGNSGGPLLNLRGEVIGMNTAVAGGAQNIGFAIPAVDLERAISSYKQFGRIVQPYIGVRYMPITPAVQEEYDLAYDHGALVVSGGTPDNPAVIPGSPADTAGLKEGDIILSVDGQELSSEQDLSSVIRRKSVGDTVNLRVYSEGSERDVDLTLDEMSA